MSTPKPRANILDVKPYVGGEGRVAGVDRLIRLASNENPLGPSPLAQTAYQKVTEDLHRYPDGGAADLRSGLAKKHNIDAQQIVCGAGSDELISLICRSYTERGDEIVYSKHGFLKYAIDARIAGATPVAAEEKDLRADPQSLLDAVTENTKLMFLANPNNPTGSWLNRDALTYICDNLPEHVLFIIDSAYAEYMQDADYEDGISLIQKYPNVAMLRTFSKIYGLPGLRLGWGYFSPETTDALNRARGPFNVNTPAQAAGVTALDDTDFIQHSLEMNNQGRVQLTEGLQELGLHPYPSAGNFILTRFGENAETIRLALKDQGIFIRQMGVYHLPECLRITIGREEDNAALLAALKTLL